MGIKKFAMVALSACALFSSSFAWTINWKYINGIETGYCGNKLNYVVVRVSDVQGGAATDVLHIGQNRLSFLKTYNMKGYADLMDIYAQVIEARNLGKKFYLESYTNSVVNSNSEKILKTGEDFRVSRTY